METDVLKAFQARLAALGYYHDKIDGLLGPASRKAAVAFKREMGLNPREYIGPITLGLLFSDDAKRAPRLPAPAVAGAIVVPPWLAIARTKLGLHEKANYAELAAWLRSDGPTLGDPRVLPWCGDFIQTCMLLALPNEVLPKNPYLAQNWKLFGKKVTPCVGAVLSFWRGSPTSTSGHVAFYEAEDDTSFLVIGGNQSNSITRTRIAKNRLVGSTWPTTYTGPLTGPSRTVLSGALSENEA